MEDAKSLWKKTGEQTDVRAIYKKNFSYKFDVVIKKQKDGSVDHTHDTEYYDSVSGLTMRFKNSHPVDEFDESGGGDESYWFPLELAFNFLFSLGQFSENLETHIVFKWPEYIENEIKNCGFIRMNPDFVASHILDLESRDKDFFELIGKPIISNWKTESGGRYDLDSYQKFENKDKGLQFNFKLKIFWPGNDDNCGMVETRIPPIGAK